MKQQTLTIARTVKTGLGAFAIAALGTTVYSATAFADTADEILKGANKTGQQGGTTVETGIETVINLLLFGVGVIAVIAIIIGGIRYTTSNGDQGSITSAKNTIMYAVIGLIVAIIAFAIVRWVVDVFV